MVDISVCFFVFVFNPTVGHCNQLLTDTDVHVKFRLENHQPEVLPSPMHVTLRWTFCFATFALLPTLRFLPVEHV